MATDDFSRARLDSMINMRHLLAVLDLNPALDVRNKTAVLAVDLIECKRPAAAP